MDTTDATDATQGPAGPPPPRREVPPATDDVVASLRAGGSVFAEREAAVLRRAFSGADLDRAVRRRAGGDPLEHVVGWADFAGVRVAVRPPVFVPRRRAEALVDATSRVLPGPDAVVVDLGCGSGALAAAVLARHPSVRCHATDVDPAAVACARENAVAHGFTVHEGSWFAPLPGGLRHAVDVVVAHLPYVPTEDMRLLPGDHRGAERAVALDGGPDGLTPLREVLADLAGWLSPGGVLLTQVSRAQEPLAAAVARDLGFRARRRTVPDGGTVVLVRQTSRRDPGEVTRSHR